MKKLYRCALCGWKRLQKKEKKNLNGKYTTTLHEIISGHGRRKLSIKYKVQIPLCIYCHIRVHKNTKKWNPILCEIIGFDYDDLRLAFNTRDYKWLEETTKKREKKLNEYLQ